MSGRYDLFSQAYKRNPFPELQRLNADGPVVSLRYPLLGGVKAVTSYEAVKEVLLDRQTFVRDPVTAGLKQGANLPWWMPKAFGPLARVMINRDEPDHRRLRGLVEKAFVRRNVSQLRPHLEKLVDRRLDDCEQAARSGEPVELISLFARPFPIDAICELLGIPEEDRQQFARDAEVFAKPMSVWSALRLIPSIRGITRYIEQQIAACRRSPRPGLITALIEVEEAGEKLTEEEMVSMVVLLLLAGHITTVHLIGGGIFTLLEHTEQKQNLLSDWGLLPGCVNELLRYLSPVQTTKPMMPIRDMEWRGTRLRRGERMVALLAAANADENVFAQPERFDMTRSPNPHLAFGTGIHVCLGMQLADAEAEVSLQRLFTRFPDLRQAIPAEKVRWSPQFGTHGLETLPVYLK